ncbi:MAG: efflux RND transporter periplasmic adaptor subunit [Pirellulaceae bacterium]
MNVHTDYPQAVSPTAPVGPSRTRVDAGSLELRKRLAESNRQLQSTAWLLELMQRIAEFELASDACHEITSQFKNYLSASSVVLVLTNRRGASRVVSVTDVAHVDPESEIMRRYRATADEALERGSIALSTPNSETTGSDAEPTYSQRLLSGGDRDVLSIPLQAKSGSPVGALLILAPVGGLSSDSGLQSFLEAAELPLATSLLQCQRSQRTRLSRLASRIAKAPVSSQVTVISGFVALIALLCYPVTYRVSCSFQVEPQRRFYCVAPHDGILARTNARPGDSIEAGQVLAEMDGREVRLELAELTAERERLSRQRDVYIASHDTAKSVQSELEMQRIDARAALLAGRQGRLSVSAPVHGIVLSGDVDQRENFPVKQGDLLFEVAPLDQLRFEVHIPDDEIQHIDLGMHVAFEVDGLGGTSYKAEIDHIRPQAEIVQGVNGFVAECTVTNADGRLRPGMRGHAKIASHSHSIGWIVFHRAFDRLQQWW